MFVTNESGAAALCRAIVEDIEVARAFELEPGTAMDMLVLLLLGPDREPQQRVSAMPRESGIVLPANVPQRGTARVTTSADELPFLCPT